MRERADRVDVEDPQPILDNRKSIHDFRGGVFSQRWRPTSFMKAWESSAYSATLLIVSKGRVEVGPRSAL
jgi:hypothetical protein